MDPGGLETVLELDKAPDLRIPTPTFLPEPIQGYVCPWAGMCVQVCEGMIQAVTQGTQPDKKNCQLHGFRNNFTRYVMRNPSCL